MSKRRIVIIGVLLGVVVIGGVGAIRFWEYHERPEFCGICHIMEPYLVSWEDSEYGSYAHAVEDVTCLECHDPTVEQQVHELVVYMQGDFTVPLEEREYGNEFCFDCHETNEHTSYEEVIQLTADLELNPHGSHLGQLECEICHKMHGLSEDYCADCHGPVATGPGWTIEATRTAEIDIWEPDMDCTVCHVMVPYVGSLKDTNLLAYAHAEEGLGCLDCHDVEESEQVHEEAVAGRPVTPRYFERESCFDCHLPNQHTTYQEIIERTADYTIDDREINPHDPHAAVEEPGQYECYYCHKMHTESPLIDGCYNACHHEGTFETCLACHTTAAGGD